MQSKNSVSLKDTAKSLLNKANQGVQAIKTYASAIGSSIANYPKMRDLAVLRQELKSVPSQNRNKFVEVTKLLDNKKISSDEGGQLYSLLRSGKDVLLDPYYVRKSRSSNFDWSPYQTEGNLSKYYNIPRK